MLSLLITVLLALPVPARAGTPFHDLSFQQASAQAEREKKLVFIDFFTTWCAPCKKLDATTWKDERVAKWLAEKTVALKIDAEKEAELAKRYRVEGYPTLLLLRQDGSEIDRVVGYRDAETFLSEFEQALAGKDALTRAKEKIAGKEKDPMARSQYAGELVRAGRYEEALAEYLWCFDEGEKANRAYSGVRVSFLLGDISRLGAKYPPAIKALEERRDAAEKRFLEGASPETESLGDALALNDHLKATDRNLALFDQIRKREPVPPLVRLRLMHKMPALLAGAKRYDDVMWLVPDPTGYLRDKIRMFEMTQSFAKQRGEEGPDALAEGMLKGRLVSDVATIYEAQLAIDDRDGAGEVAAKLVEWSPSGSTWATLIEAAVSAKAFDVATDHVSKALETLSEDEAKVVKRAAKKIPQPK